MPSIAPTKWICVRFLSFDTNQNSKHKSTAAITTGIQGGLFNEPLPDEVDPDGPTTPGRLGACPPIRGKPGSFAPGPPSGLRPGIGGGLGMFTKASVRLVEISDKF